MRVSRLLFVILAAVCFLPAGRALAQDLPFSARLVENPERYDGTRITFEGEVIGEAMRRGEYAWLHVNDDTYSLATLEEGGAFSGYNTGQAVWIPVGLLEGVDVFGDYDHRGDIVHVNGEFRAACTEHGGDMDIHADGLEVVARGRRVPDEVPSWKLAAALGSWLAAAVAFVWHRRDR